MVEIGKEGKNARKWHLKTQETIENTDLIWR